MARVELVRSVSAPPAALTAIQVLSLAAVYFGAAKAGLSLAVIHPSATAVWPPTGIAIAALLLFGARLWPGIAIGAFLANATTAGTWLTSAGIATGNTLEAVLAAWMLRRWSRGAGAIDGPGGVLRYVILAAGVSTLVSATCGVLSLAMAGYAPWPEFGGIWTTWWLGDAVGALVVGTPILLWSSSERPARPHRPLEATGAVLLFAATGAIYYRSFAVKNVPIAWIWLPVLLWVAYRFGRRAAATTVLGLAVVTIWGTWHGAGPFALPSANSSLLLLQAFLGVMSVTTLTLSAVVAANQGALAELARARGELEDRVSQRTQALTRTKETLEIEISERRRLQKQLIDAGEVERRRLGRDLHDDLGQVLAGIGFLTAALRRKADARESITGPDLGEVEGHVREAIAKTRSIALGLTPVTLGTGGLRAAIEELATMTARIFDIECDARCDPSVFVDREIAATNLYRIAQEAVTNAARHGAGDRIQIALTLEGADLVLMVHDDGIGMDSNRDHRVGMGLRTMRSRAESLGGVLRVESGESGTTVTCVVPHVARRIPPTGHGAS